VSLRLPPEDYHELFTYILSRDGYKCRNCGWRTNLSVHHIIFRSQGGPDEDWNLVTLCTSCHDGIHKDVRPNGEPGLTVVVPANAEEHLIFIRGDGWRPR
jgi:5-methylcytosine-specific restriction endonuclease McrA